MYTMAFGALAICVFHFQSWYILKNRFILKEQIKEASFFF